MSDLSNFQVVAVLKFDFEYAVDADATDNALDELYNRIHNAIVSDLKLSKMTEGLVAKTKTMTVSMGYGFGLKPGKKTEQAVALCGNIRDGFKVVGPFPDLSVAEEIFDGAHEVLPLHAPDHPYHYAQQNAGVEKYVDETLDNFKHLDENEVIDLLDGLIHDAASRIGSGVNNEGPEAQLRFLVEQWGLEEVKKQLDEEKLLKDLSTNPNL